MATIKKYLFIITVYVLLFTYYVAPIHAATFKMSPASATFSQNCNYSVDILLDTENIESNAADIFINYDPTKFEVNEVKPGTTYGDYFGNIVDSNAGTIRLTGASFNSKFNGNGVFATILFKPKTNTGNSYFNIFYTGANPYNSLDSNVADAATSNDLLSGIQNGFYAFNTGTCVNDTSPPNVTFITPTNNQTNIPADANIVLTVGDSGSGVDINKVAIAINGINYTIKNSQVSFTGDSTKYNFTVNPVNPLSTTFANTVLVTTTDHAGNSTQKLITFNLPTSAIACIPSITTTPTPTTSQTLTPIPTLIPTNIPAAISTLAPTQIPTAIPTPTAAPVAEVDNQSPQINFISPLGKQTVDLTPEIKFGLSDVGSGINLDSIQLTLNDQLFTFDNPGFSSSGSKNSTIVTFQVKKNLIADTDYNLTIFASDNSNNSISKTIMVRTQAPFLSKITKFFSPIITLMPIIFIGLLILGVIGLLFYLLGAIKPNHGVPYGLVYDTTTLEPIPNFEVYVVDGNDRFIKSTKTNIFGIFSFELNNGNYKFVVNNKESELISVPSNTKDFLKIPFTPTKVPKDDRLPELLNQLLVLLKLKLPPHGFVFNSESHLQTNLTINLVDPITKTVISSRQTDSLGRYRFLVPNGYYSVEISEFPKDNFIVDTRHLTSGYTTINRNLFL